MNNITLYHYSDKKLNNIEPRYFGANSYTFNDIRASKIKRAFFYIQEAIPEYRFETSQFLHIAEISGRKIYDLRIDKKGLRQKYQGNIEGLLSYIKRKYDGAIYNVGFDIAILFKSVKSKKIIERVL